MNSLEDNLIAKLDRAIRAAEDDPHGPDVVYLDRGTTVAARDAILRLRAALIDNLRRSD